MHEKRKHAAVIGLIAASTLPFFFIINSPFADGFSSDALISYLSSVLGYAGISLLVWQLLLGTRSISGLFFDDLSAKLKLHSWLGKYGLLFVFAHPILIMFRYSESITYLFLPSLSSEFEEHVTFGRLAFIALLTIWLTSAISRSKISYRPWKYIHYLAYPTLVASLLHVPEIGSSFEQQAVRFYWYVVVGIVIIAFALRARFFVGWGKASYQLIGKKQLTDQIFMYRFRPSGQNYVTVRTGQYVYLQISQFGEDHPFTVLDHDEATGEFSVAFKVFGRYTRKLTTLNVEDIILIDGPYGVFTSELAIEPAMKTVFIAGGIGITPFVKHVLERPKDLQYMFFANQNSQSAVFQELLHSKLAEHYTDVYSHEAPSETSPDHVRYGFMRPELVAEKIANPQEFNYFICGPKPMMNASVAFLKNMGVPKNQIHLEEFSF